MRSANATKKQPSNTGTPKCAMLSLSASPMPDARNTPPNIPPAPVIRITEQTGPSVLSSVFSNALPFMPRLVPRKYIAANTEISKATGVLPIMRKNCTADDLPSTQPAALAMCKPVFKKINSMGIIISDTTKPAPAGCLGWSSSCLPPAIKSGTLMGNILSAAKPHA